MWMDIKPFKQNDRFGQLHLPLCLRLFGAHLYNNIIIHGIHSRGAPSINKHNSCFKQKSPLKKRNPTLKERGELEQWSCVHNKEKHTFTCRRYMF